MQHKEEDSAKYLDKRLEKQALVLVPMPSPNPHAYKQTFLISETHFLH
jgi:hypothetical protein